MSNTSKEWVDLEPSALCKVILKSTFSTPNTLSPSKNTFQVNSGSLNFLWKLPLALEAARLLLG
nr:MAG TPA: hypothetical protein [Bacteriophage sp.]DAO41084.1 MAG TPA: hypothetical protein [Bacteriophage sp.]